MAMGTMRQITATGTQANLLTPLTTETQAATDDLILHVRNAAGSSMTVTLTDPGTTPSGSTAAAAPVTIPATTGDVYIFVQATLASPTTGLVTATFSTTTSVTAEWLRM